MLPDHLNPRLWLRDWLNKPSRAERERDQAEARFWADLRESQAKEAEERLQEAKRLAAKRAAQASTSVSGDA